MLEKYDLAAIRAVLVTNLTNPTHFTPLEIDHMTEKLNSLETASEMVLYTAECLTEEVAECEPDMVVDYLVETFRNISETLRNEL